MNKYCYMTKGCNLQGVRVSVVMRTHDGRRERERQREGWIILHTNLTKEYSNLHIMNE